MGAIFLLNITGNEQVERKECTFLSLRFQSCPFTVTCQLLNITGNEQVERQECTFLSLRFQSCPFDFNLVPLLLLAEVKLTGLLAISCVCAIKLKDGIQQNQTSENRTIRGFIRTEGCAEGSEGWAIGSC